MPKLDLTDPLERAIFEDAFNTLMTRIQSHRAALLANPTTATHTLIALLVSLAQSDLKDEYDEREQELIAVRVRALDCDRNLTQLRAVPARYPRRAAAAGSGASQRPSSGPRGRRAAPRSMRDAAPAHAVRPLRPALRRQRHAAERRRHDESLAAQRHLASAGQHSLCAPARRLPAPGDAVWDRPLRAFASLT
jgi:hypothetical protein